MATISLGSVTDKSILSYYNGGWNAHNTSDHSGFQAGGSKRQGGVIRFKTPTFSNASGYQNYKITISKLDIVNNGFTDSATSRIIYASLFSTNPWGRDPFTNYDLNADSDRIGSGSVSYGSNGAQVLTSPTSITINCTSKLASNTWYYLWVRGQTYDFINNIFYNNTFNGSVSAETVSYTITYNLNGGTAASTLKTSYSVASDTFTLPQVSKTGHTFTGWTGSNGSTPNKTVTITKGSTTGNKTYTANFSEHALTVNLYGNGATYGTYKGAEFLSPGTDKLVTQTFLYNDQYNSGIANIQNSDYLFLKKTGYFPTGNWSTSTTLGSGSLVSQDFGGTGQEIAAKVGKTLVSASQSVNLYVQWTPKVITVRFNKNDGSGTAPASQSFTYGATGNKFGYKTDGTEQWPATNGSYADLYGFGQWYRNGYKIIGWAHSASATTPDYTTYSGVANSWIDDQVGEAASKTIDLYAVWDYNGTVRIYKDGAWKMALPYVYAKVGAETSPSWHLALPYTYAQGTGETSPSWHLNGG